MATFSPYYVEVPGRFRSKVDENSYTEFSGKETSKPCHEFMKKLLSSAKVTTPLSANTNAAQSSESELNNLPSLTYDSSCPPYQSKTLKSGDLSPSSTVIELGEKSEIGIKEHNPPSYHTNGSQGVLVKSNTCSAKPRPNEIFFPTYTSSSRCKTPSDTATISTRCSFDTEPDDEKVLLSRPFEKGDLARRSRVLKKRPEQKGQSEVKNPTPRKLEKIYSSNVVYETTMKASAIEFCTGTKKVVWQDPEVSGEYVSFLPSMTETEDRDEIFRRQSVVRGYSKRTLPHYTVAVKAAVMQRKKDQAWWKVFGRNGVI